MLCLVDMNMEHPPLAEDIKVLSLPDWIIEANAEKVSIKSLADLSPSIILSTKKPYFKAFFVSLFTKKKESDVLLEQQWNELHSMSWSNTDDLNVELFWVTVINHKDTKGEHMTNTK